MHVCTFEYAYLPVSEGMVANQLCGIEVNISSQIGRDGYRDMGDVSTYGKIIRDLLGSINLQVQIYVQILKNSREKRRKCISVTGSLRGQAQVRPIDKLDEACTNADDRMMRVQHCSGNRVMS